MLLDFSRPKFPPHSCRRSRARRQPSDISVIDIRLNELSCNRRKPEDDDGGESGTLHKIPASFHHHPGAAAAAAMAAFHSQQQRFAAAAAAAAAMAAASASPSSDGEEDQQQQRVDDKLNAGVARHKSPSNGECNLRIISRAYFAPPHLQGSVKEWSLGCVLASLAAGARFMQPRDRSLADPC